MAATLQFQPKLTPHRTAHLERDDVHTRGGAAGDALQPISAILAPLPAHRTCSGRADEPNRTPLATLPSHQKQSNKCINAAKAENSEHC